MYSVMLNPEGVGAMVMEKNQTLMTGLKWQSVFTCKNHSFYLPENYLPALKN